ncbi:TMAO reductase system periplasmic protein TorT [Shewanella sp. JM162201]|uniref:TMAO reductase system periplasmic protein TorT n=2 Tax=Shewanella jiangmenensis TaxID=2837387 RepID=A0ABS5V0Q8_9GAMM|nr:TMAO reductase system periplasmic protein TorT [Shewanella jiangmenensis]
MALPAAAQTEPAKAQWYPLQMMVDGKPASFEPPTVAGKLWRLCALLPHGKDHYWWGVAWGLSEEAKRLGVEIGIYDAGGYDKLAMQKQQLRDCYKLKADAYIIAAIAADGLNAEAELLYNNHIPVIDLVNGMSTSKVSSRSLVHFSDMTRAAVAFMLKQPVQGKQTLGWFPGPEGAAWVTDAETGLNTALEGQPFTLYHGGYGMTETFAQADLVRKMVAAHHPDYIIANAVAATVASKYFTDGKRGKTKVISFYSNPQTIALTQEGALQATVTDSPVLQARVAVDLAVRWLDTGNAPKRVSPIIKVLTPENIKDADLEQTLPPANQWMIHQQLSPIDGATARIFRNLRPAPKTE